MGYSRSKMGLRRMRGQRLLYLDCAGVVWCAVERGYADVKSGVVRHCLSLVGLEKVSVSEAGQCLRRLGFTGVVWCAPHVPPTCPPRAPHVVWGHVCVAGRHG